MEIAATSSITDAGRASPEACPTSTSKASALTPTQRPALFSRLPAAGSPCPAPVEQDTCRGHARSRWHGLLADDPSQHLGAQQGAAEAGGERDQACRHLQRDDQRDQADRHVFRFSRCRSLPRPLAGSHSSGLPARADPGRNQELPILSANAAAAELDRRGPGARHSRRL
jgi:hypothetical protein